jgi:hypothetical protein
MTIVITTDHAKEFLRQKAQENWERNHCVSIIRLLEASEAFTTENIFNDIKKNDWIWRPVNLIDDLAITAILVNSGYFLAKDTENEINIERKPHLYHHERFESLNKYHRRYDGFADAKFYPKLGEYDMKFLANGMVANYMKFLARCEAQDDKELLSLLQRYKDLPKTVEILERRLKPNCDPVT